MSVVLNSTTVRFDSIINIRQVIQTKLIMIM